MLVWPVSQPRLNLDEHYIVFYAMSWYKHVTFFILDNRLGNKKLLRLRNRKMHGEGVCKQRLKEEKRNNKSLSCRKSRKEMRHKLSMKRLCKKNGKSLRRSRGVILRDVRKLLLNEQRLMLRCVA